MSIAATAAVAGSYRPPGFVQRGLKALYLMEQERKNLVKHSEDFSNAAWGKLGSTLTANQVEAPFGGALADLLVESAVNENHYLNQTISGLADNAGPFVSSVYAKQGTRSWIRLRVQEKNGAGMRAWFNLAAGTVGTVDPGASYEAGIEDVGNGWYRCWVTTGSVNTGASLVSAQYFVQTADNQTNYLGDGASGIYVWGAQFGAGTRPLPYVPTTNKQALYDYSGEGNDAFLGSAGSAFIQPIHKYLSLPGTAGNYASTPAGYGIPTADVDVIVRAALPNWTDGAAHTLLAVRGGSVAELSFSVMKNTIDALEFAYTLDGVTASYPSRTLPTLDNGKPVWLRVKYEADNGAGSRVIAFYYSTEMTSDPLSVSWTLVGPEVVVAGVGGLNQVTRIAEVGTFTAGQNGRLNGYVSRALLIDGWLDGGGISVLDFNPADAHGDVSQFYSGATGELWTINQAAGASDTNDPVWTGEGTDFDGTDDYSVAAPATFLRGAGALTIFSAGELGPAALEQRAFQAKWVGLGTGWLLDTYNGSLRAFILSTAAQAVYAYTPGDAFVAARGKAGTATLVDLFVGSNKVATSPAGDRAVIGSSHSELVLLGAKSDNGAIAAFANTLRYFHGIYDVVLTDAEIEQNYRAARYMLAQRGVLI